MLCSRKRLLTYAICKLPDMKTRSLLSSSSEVCMTAINDHSNYMAKLLKWLC